VHHNGKVLKSFLFRKTGDDSHDRHIVFFFQQKFFLKRLLAFFLPRHISCRISCWNKLVGLRIPVIVISPIQNSKKIRLPSLDINRKPVSARFGHNFLSVTWADSGDGIRVKNRAFHEINTAEILKLGVRKIFGPKSQKRINIGFESSLISNVVYGKNARGFLKKRIPGFPDLQIRRDQRRLPIVTMDNIRLEFKVLTKLDTGACKKAETLGIIQKFPPTVIIKTGATEIMFMLDKVNCKTIDLSFKNLAPENTVPRCDPHGS